jgi:hypothetical protein
MDAIGNVKPDIAKLRAEATQLQTYLLQMSNDGRVIYCRFGKDYIAKLQKEALALINSPNLTNPMKQIATYLINIKKLVRDHNIESESKDFNRLNTMKPTSF